MLNNLKNLFLRKKLSPPSAGQQDGEVADPRRVGLQDAVNCGWYQWDTGELLQGFRIAPEDTVLDVGCGDGLATLFCASQGAHVVFSDMNQKKINTLLEKAGRSKARKVEGYVSDSNPLPLQDQYASKVLAMEMLEHTESPEDILSELYRVGKPGAQYLITVPDERSEFLQKSFASPSYFAPPNHIQIFEKKRFCQMVESSGLVIERYMTWGFYWVMWMSIFWSLNEQRTQGETMEFLGPPYHPALISWTQTWKQIMALPDAQAMVDAFNQVLPKAQAVIARKPDVRH